MRNTPVESKNFYIESYLCPQRVNRFVATCGGKSGHQREA